MSENTLMLEILKNLQAGQAAMHEDIREVLHRLNRLEVSDAHHGVDTAELHGRVDRMNERISRIEKRLEIVD